MIENSKNKGSVNSKNKVLGGQNQEFHFAGSGIYFPLTVVATNSEDAEKIWKEKRVPYQKEDNEKDL